MATARPTIEPLAVFATQWSGELILITSRASLAGALAKFDFSGFIPSLVKYRRLFSEVLVVGLIVVVVFESVLTTLRTCVFSHTTSRIDVELGARLFRHLVNLPLAYFQARRVGDSVAACR